MLREGLGREVLQVSRQRVPAFLSVHVEPDAYQLGPAGPASWTGYDALHQLMSSLRAELAERQGVTPRFSWMFRMDPQIAATNPTGAHAVSGFGDRVAGLANQGDVFGIHVHPLRWSNERELWIHDFTDPAWARHCIESSVDTFRNAFGVPPRRHSYGAAFLDEHLTDVLEDVGIRVDLSADRRYLSKEVRQHPEDVLTGVDTSPVIGVYPDGSRIPRFAYRPSRTDARRPDDRHGRQVVLVPLTAAPRGHERPKWRRAASWLRHGMHGRLMTMYPAVQWSNPSDYWDLVERGLRWMPRPYVAISVRTDAPDSAYARNARALFECLPSHRVARRLRFVDPLQQAPSLLSRRARRGLAWG